MEKQRDSKIIALIALVVAVIGTTVAFAALSDNLAIGGAETSVVVDARWNIEFISISTATDGQGKFNTSPVINNLDSTKIDDYSATLSAPGDSITINFSVKNKGTIDAALTDITMNNAAQLTCESIAEPIVPDDTNKVCNELTYTLTDQLNNNIIEGSKLPAGQTVNMKLVLTYDFDESVDTTTELPSGNVSISGLGVSLKYDQD